MQPSEELKWLFAEMDKENGFEPGTAERRRSKEAVQ